MTPLSHVGQTARPERPADAEAQPPVLPPESDRQPFDATRSTRAIAQDIHLGVRFKVEAVARDGLFEGRFTIYDEVPPGRRTGTAYSLRPTVDNRWATRAEALTYATEAAHHAIEGMRPSFTSGPTPGM